MTPVRVGAVIEQLHVGGDENRMLTVAAGLDPEYFEYFVYVAVGIDEARDRQLGPMVDRYADAGIEVKVFNLDPRPGRRRHGRRRPVRDGVVGAADAVRLVAALARQMRQDRIDVVDARLEFGTIFGVAAGRLAGVTGIVSTGYSPARFSNPAFWLAGQTSLAGVDVLVSDADATIAEYEAWMRLRPPELVMIPNGLAPATPTRPRGEVRQELGLPAGATVVGQLSRMIPRKGFDVLLHAAQTVHGQHPDLWFLLCGFAEYPEYRQSLRVLAAELGIADRTVITDYPGAVGDVMGVIDVFAHISTFDSSPMAIHESMSAGLPAVVSIVGGTPDLVDDGVTGLLVDAGDAAAAAAALLAMLDNPELAARLGHGARLRYARRHRPETMVQAHADLFGRVAAHRGATLSGRARLAGAHVNPVGTTSARVDGR